MQERSASTEAPQDVVSGGSHQEVTTVQPEGTSHNVTYRDAVAEPEARKLFEIQRGNILTITTKPLGPRSSHAWSVFPSSSFNSGSSSIPENIPVKPLILPNPAVSGSHSSMMAFGNGFRCCCGRYHRDSRRLSIHQGRCSVARHDDMNPSVDSPVCFLVLARI